MNYLVALTLVAATAAQSTFSPARPPAIPLAVRSPYLSAWQSAGSDDGNGGYLAGQWPIFWDGNTLGWAGLIQVDGTTYTWMGAPAGFDTVNQTSFEYTATRSVFTQNVNDEVEITVTFLTPITPEDYVRQSIISSYLQVSVVAIDGQNHAVQLYTDISAEWVSGDRTATAQWDYGVASEATNATDPSLPDIAYHRVYRQEQLAFAEVSDQTKFGYWYYMTANTSTLTFQSGVDVDVRGEFSATGGLADSQDTAYRAIDDQYPVFGFAFDLGFVGNDTVEALFTINLNQQDAVIFEGADGNQTQPSLWTAFFDSDLDANAFFYNDYVNASLLSDDIDYMIRLDSTEAAGSNYSLITELAARQAFGAIQLTGTENNTLLFLKEISSDGNIQTVDVIFPWHPIALYLNPELVKFILEPLFINEEAGWWPETYSIHDLGSNYPNATGHNDGVDEYQPLEECGNMVIMSLAYAQSTDDNDWLESHYTILNQWTGYLVSEALIPMDQISTDDFAGALANQTNLALKGIIGIQAMAEIANRTSHPEDAANYTSIAASYIQQWITFATTTNATLPHTTLNYGNESSYSLLYNLYASRLLGQGDFVPQQVYDQQSAFYPSVALQYGVPLDTRHTYTKLDWQLWTAAIASNSTQALFINDIAAWIHETPTGYALTDLYDAITGDYPAGLTFIARPVVGGAFSLLALPVEA